MYSVRYEGRAGNPQGGVMANLSQLPDMGEPVGSEWWKNSTLWLIGGAAALAFAYWWTLKRNNTGNYTNSQLSSEINYVTSTLDSMQTVLQNMQTGVTSTSSTSTTPTSGQPSYIFNYVPSSTLSNPAGSSANSAGVSTNGSESNTGSNVNTSSNVNTGSNVNTSSNANTGSNVNTSSNVNTGVNGTPSYGYNGGALTPWGMGAQSSGEIIPPNALWSAPVAQYNGLNYSYNSSGQLVPSNSLPQ
jgi:hypothetical protein